LIWRIKEMGRAGFNQKSDIIVNVSAGDITTSEAGDGTSYYYVDMRDYARSSMQFTKSGSGTATWTLEATSQDFQSEAASASGTFVDVSTAVLGAASVTASALKTDIAGITGTVTFLRHKLVIVSSETDTAYKLVHNKTW
jgi:hypothetical protein